MNRERALIHIVHGSPHERLMAARELTRSALKADLPIIERAFRKETVLWTKTAISDILDRLRKSDSEKAEITDQNQGTPIDIPDAFVRDLHAQAVRETTSLILHEVQPLFGRLAKSVRDEVRDFPNSRSRQRIERLIKMLAIIAEIRSASTAPTFQQFDLEELVRTVCEDVAAGSPIQIQLAGRKPFVIVSDPGRIRLAFENGLRNAVEATAAASTEVIGEPVVVTWGSRPEEIWLAILDGGNGIPVESSRMFRIGTTTKKDHFGMGLPLAQQAIMSIGGDLSLTNRLPQGAKLELHWPIYQANQTAPKAPVRG